MLALLKQNSQYCIIFSILFVALNSFAADPSSIDLFKKYGGNEELVDELLTKVTDDQKNFKVLSFVKLIFVEYPEKSGTEKAALERKAKIVFDSQILTEEQLQNFIMVSIALSNPDTLHLILKYNPININFRQKIWKNHSPYSYALSKAVLDLNQGTLSPAIQKIIEILETHKPEIEQKELEYLDKYYKKLDELTKK